MRGGLIVNIIVHMPKTDKIAELQNKVAEVHSDMVMSYINNLSCSKEQKLKLVESLQSVERD